MKITVLSSVGVKAEEFFKTINENKADLVLDVRLNNTSQLAGFTKEDTLAYLVPLLTKARYVHDTRFSPDRMLLKEYLRGKIDYQSFSKQYLEEMKEKDARGLFVKDYGEASSLILIGAGTKKRHSHSEALKDYLEEKENGRK
jgi:uncharacterized protein YeaO (DUF488 family)